MNKKIDKIKRSNKIYPIFYGLSADLIFFIGINTLFLTEVKGLSIFDINLITTLGTLFSLFFYLTSHKFIKKIGNINSIKLGTILIIIAVLLFIFGTNIYTITLAQILYEVSFVFKNIDTVILNNNLVYEKKEDDFIKIKSKASTIYSFATLVASLLSGLLFSINPYIPLILCLTICINNFILSHLIYEIDYQKEEKQKDKTFKINKYIIVSIITYGLVYGTIAICQNNDKLFIQYKLKEFLELNNVAIILSIILTLSRVSRLISNLLFVKIYNILKNKILYLINIGLIISILLFIIGSLLTYPIYGAILMAIGFILLLALRDPTENVLSNILLKHTKKEHKEQAILYFNFARRLTTLLISLMATAILKKYELINLYYIILLFSIIYLFIIKRLIKIVKNQT